MHYEKFTVQIRSKILLDDAHALYSRFLAERSQVSKKVKNARKKVHLL